MGTKNGESSERPLRTHLQEHKRPSGVSSPDAERVARKKHNIDWDRVKGLDHTKAHNDTSTHLALGAVEGPQNRAMEGALAARYERAAESRYGRSLGSALWKRAVEGPQNRAMEGPLAARCVRAVEEVCGSVVVGLRRIKIPIGLQGVSRRQSRSADNAVPLNRDRGRH
ncbi:hypothetical protein Bbelb_248630 [Branchiostoma belcheri]|nr:hypothetical protein Bbelb_248630 [Branchiostoma belcheri]